MLAPVIFLAVIGALIVYALSANRADLVIDVRPNKVEMRGHIARARLVRFHQYFDTLRNDRQFTVLLNYRSKGLPMKIRFRGPLTEGEKQQIRNYLLSEV